MTVFHKASGVISGAEVGRSSDQSKARAHEKETTRTFAEGFPEG